MTGLPFDVAPHWLWFVAAALLATAEMLAPGYFMIWLAAAAAITGALAHAMPDAYLVQCIAFAVMAVAAVYLGRRWLASHPVTSADPLLNDRGRQLVGAKVFLTQPIAGGTGRARHGDTEWLVHGPDAPAGTLMEVTGHDGAILLVGPITSSL